MPQGVGLLAYYPSRHFLVSVLTPVRDSSHTENIVPLGTRFTVWGFSRLNAK